MKKEKSSKLLFKTTAILTSFLGAGLLVNGTQQVVANSNTANATVPGTTEVSNSSSSAPATSTPASTTSSSTAATTTAPATSQAPRVTVNANANVSPAHDGTTTQVNGSTSPQVNGTVPATENAQVAGAVTTDTTKAPLSQEDIERIWRNLELEMIKVGENIIAGKYKSIKDIGTDVENIIATKTEGDDIMGLAVLEMSLIMMGDSPIDNPDDFSQDFKDMVVKVNEKTRFTNTGTKTTKAVYLKESDLEKFGEADVAKAISLDHTTPNVYIEEVRNLDKLKSAKHGDKIELEVLLLSADHPNLIADVVDVSVIVDNEMTVNIGFGSSVRHPLLKSELNTVIPGAFRSRVDAGFGVPVAATVSDGSTSKSGTNSSRSNNTNSTQSSSNRTTAARSLNLPSTGETRAAVVLAAGLATLGLAGFLFFKHRSVKK